MSAPVFRLLQALRHGRRPALRTAELVGLQVETLPAHHAGRPGGAGEPRDEGGACSRAAGSGVARQHLESQGQQGVARKDGRPVIERLVHRRPAAAHLVVVHGRQVVVHQGVAVHQLQGGCRIQRNLRRHVEEGRRLR